MCRTCLREKNRSVMSIRRCPFVLKFWRVVWKQLASENSNSWVVCWRPPKINRRLGKETGRRVRKGCHSSTAPSNLGRMTSGRGGHRRVHWQYELTKRWCLPGLLRPLRVLYGRNTATTASVTHWRHFFICPLFPIFAYLSYLQFSFFSESLIPSIQVFSHFAARARGFPPPSCNINGLGSTYRDRFPQCTKDLYINVKR